MLHGKSLPEVNNNVEKSAKSPASPDSPTPIPLLKWLWLLITLVITVAIAIGVGIGVWYTKRKGSSETRYNLLLALYCDSLSFPIYRIPVRRLLAHQQHIHLPIYPLLSIFSITRHWQLQFFLTVTDIYTSRIILILFDTLFALQQPANGIQVSI